MESLVGFPNNTFPGKSFLFREVEETASDEAETDAVVVGATTVGIMAAAIVVSFAAEEPLRPFPRLLPCSGCVPWAGESNVGGTAEVGAGAAGCTRSAGCAGGGGGGGGGAVVDGGTA